MPALRKIAWLTSLSLDAPLVTVVWQRSLAKSTSANLEGYLCYVDFAQPIRQPMRSLSKIVLPILYAFFRLTTGLSANRLPQVNWSDSLDFLERDVWLQGFIVSETWKKRAN